MHVRVCCVPVAARGGGGGGGGGGGWGGQVGLGSVGWRALGALFVANALHLALESKWSVTARFDRSL